MALNNVRIVPRNIQTRRKSLGLRLHLTLSTKSPIMLILVLAFFVGWLGSQLFPEHYHEVNDDDNIHGDEEELGQDLLGPVQNSAVEAVPVLLGRIHCGSGGKQR